MKKRQINDEMMDSVLKTMLSEYQEEEGRKILKEAEELTKDSELGDFAKEEVTRLSEEIKTIEDKIEIILLPKVILFPDVLQISDAWFLNFFVSETWDSLSPFTLPHEERKQTHIHNRNINMADL